DERLDLAEAVGRPARRNVDPVGQTGPSSAANPRRQSRSSLVDLLIPPIADELCKRDLTMAFDRTWSHVQSIPSRGSVN
ncbi:MAG: hypothetical protein ABEL76_06150, partial [Bradymonadaceae bacterium]